MKNRGWVSVPANLQIYDSWRLYQGSGYPHGSFFVLNDLFHTRNATRAYVSTRPLLKIIAEVSAGFFGEGFQIRF